MRKRRYDYAMVNSALTRLDRIAESHPEIVRKEGLLWKLNVGMFMFTLENNGDGRRYTGGRIPYGYYVVNGYLVKSPAEQSVIEQARKLRDSGMPILTITQALDNIGLRHE